MSNDTFSDHFGEIWEICRLRSELNDSFYSQFNSIEKKFITGTGHEGVGDNVYLLSRSEASFLDEDIRDCDSEWWLRTGNGSKRIVVDTDGTFEEQSYDAKCGVRPAIRIRISK